MNYAQKLRRALDNARNNRGDYLAEIEDVADEIEQDMSKGSSILTIWAEAEDENTQALFSITSDGNPVCHYMTLHDALEHVEEIMEHLAADAQPEAA